MSKRLKRSFFSRDVLKVAPELIGKVLIRRFDDGCVEKFVISEVEAYSGNGDLACHASKGKTVRTEVMFREGGLVYVYFIYGMYWMLNFVTGERGEASAVLIRGLEGISGPGRVGKALQLDKSFYGENLETSDRIWVEEGAVSPEFVTTTRIGINYAGEPWVSKPWRFMMKT